MRKIKTRRPGRCFKEMAKKGAQPSSTCWTIGRYDVAVFEAPTMDATALAFSASSLGNVRSEILRAFSFEEMSGILAKMV
jgi:uncharacterized protein with GYD domain